MLQPYVMTDHYMEKHELSSDKKFRFEYQYWDLIEFDGGIELMPKVQPLNEKA